MAVNSNSGKKAKKKGVFEWTPYHTRDLGGIFGSSPSHHSRNRSPYHRTDRGPNRRRRVRPATPRTRTVDRRPLALGNKPLGRHTTLGIRSNRQRWQDPHQEVYELVSEAKLVDSPIRRPECR